MSDETQADLARQVVASIRGLDVDLAHRLLHALVEEFDVRHDTGISITDAFSHDREHDEDSWRAHLEQRFAAAAARTNALVDELESEETVDDGDG